MEGENTKVRINKGRERKNKNLPVSPLIPYVFWIHRKFVSHWLPICNITLLYCLLTETITLSSWQKPLKEMSFCQTLVMSPLDVHKSIHLLCGCPNHQRRSLLKG
jgi:hypothetical protein